MLLVLLSATPLLLLLIYSGLELRNNAAAEAQRETSFLVMKAANEYQRLVEETRQLFSVLAQVPQIQNDEHADCNSFLAKLLLENKTYANLGVINPNGDVICSGVPLQGALNVTNRTYYQRVLKSLDFSIGDYQIGRITNTAVLVFSAPVFDDSKQLKAIIFAALPLSWIKQQTTVYPLPTGSVVNVIDHSTHTLLAQYPESTMRIGSSAEKTMLVKAMHELGGSGTAEVTDPDGIKRLHTFRFLQELPGGKEIYVSIGIPVKVIYAKTNTIMVRNLAILIVVVALTLLVSWYGSNTMVLRQIASLLRVTKQVASGDLDARVSVSHEKNEISQLGYEFNKMADALEQRHDEVMRAENLLRENEKQLRHIVETVPDIIYMSTAANNFAATFVSPAISRILGFMPEEFVTDPERWEACIHNEDRTRVITQLQSVLESTEDTFCIEYRMWHKDGKLLCWVEDRAHIDRDDSGHATAIFGVITDITERKQAEMLSTRLGRILEDSWDEVYVFDATTLRFVDVSSGACRNLGYTMNELMHLTPLDLKQDLTTDQFEALLGPLRRGEKPQVTFEVDNYRKDGSHYPAEVRMQLSNTETPPVFIAILQNISERRKYIADLEHKALYDNLTDLPNRSLFQDRLTHALKVAHREDVSLAVLTVDIVRLREINDILGHHAGDLVLQEIAHRLQELLRETDTVSRLGGDEFAIVMPGVNHKHCSIAANKIQRIFEQPIIIEDTSLEIEATIGIAIYPDHGNEPDMLLQHADIAMHMAKNESTGFSIYKPENDLFSLRRLKMLGELRKAIQQKELVLYYQPQINIRQGRVTSVEALARWPHKVDGMIPPGEFIPMVEQSGLIRPFTYWVLEEAIVQLKLWGEAGINLPVSVNLSTRNLLDTELQGKITELLGIHNVSPANLTLEVTESAVMSRPEAALKVLTQLHEIGLKLSIDDYGTGYSSLAYLKKLPVDELKIDQTFVFGLTKNDDDAIIVRSTIDLAQNMGLKVVAEGVESQEILDTLAILSCDIAQGYHMSRPISAEEMDKWLVSSPWGLNNDDQWK